MEYSSYISKLQDECNLVYEIAESARKKGKDPRNFVEIPQAHDLADRTQKLLSFLNTRQTAEQIRELTEIYDGNRELVAIDIARIVAAETYLYGVSEKCNKCGGKGYNKQGWKELDCIPCESSGVEIFYLDTPHWKDTLKKFEEIEEFSNDTKIAISIYHGVCAGLAVLTEGILVAPLDGVVSCRILTNDNGTKCIAISFAGPIRSAGGTGQALSVLIGDILRRMFHLSKTVITPNEIERYKEEVAAYSRGLQYRPSNPQLDIIAQNCPVYIDGEGVGNEVSGQRDLPRVPTNKLREGAILVICEGLVLKAPKIMKYVKELNLDGWAWLGEFIIEKDEGEKTIEPSYKYLHDVLAGRPIFGQPMKKGGFRLRYGRGRLSGLATTSIHPATMKALSGFLITGTQMKYELPGKATVVTPCTTIDGPYIQFRDGSAKRIQNEKEIIDGLPIDVDWPIERIWDLGDILIPFGEFLENNHQLLPSPYVKEWHEQLTPTYPLNFSEALSQCREHQIPMAPEYVAFFNDLSAFELKRLYEGVGTSVCGNYVEIPKPLLELVYRLNIDVSIYNGNYILEGDKASVFTNSLRNGRKFKGDLNDFGNGLDFLNHIMDYEIKPSVTYRIGGRMGKPEGAKLRQMKPPIHVMFPLGSEVGSQRKITDAIKKNNKIEIGNRFCKICENETILGVCCGENTSFLDLSYRTIDLQALWNEAKMNAGIFNNLDVKGVKGMTSSEKCPENIMKGLLRLNHNISTFRDGTIRFDMVDISMTHFKPSEIGLTLNKAQELGYGVEDKDEIIELYPQDIVISKTCAHTILKTSQYIDELLVKLYGLAPYYNADKVEDLFGHLFMGLAPHTSGAILCRLIGVAEIKGHYGHPFFHAAKRRNCDGDIDSIMLLMDGLINFSKLFLSTHRGGNMDAPLILTTQINPSEIDKEALNLDVNWTYPKEFYELTQKSAHPKVALEGQIRTIGSLLGTPKEFRGLGYTHDTQNCSDGPKNNPYNTIDSMRQKTLVQFALGTTLYCVDNEDQSSRLIDRHLIRDMRGNLRAFGQQKVRCTVCGTKYRRPPISGNCNKVVETKKDPFTGQKIDVVCPGNIILTVTQGGIKKYGGLMGELVEKYGCNEYTEQLYELVSDWVSETFRNEDEKEQSKLW